MLVDRTGALWVSTPIDPPASASTWNVFAPDGAWLGTVTTPDGLRVDEIGVDYVIGVWRQRHGRGTRPDLSALPWRRLLIQSRLATNSRPAAISSSALASAL